jgi:hypothetical protein
MTCEKNMANRKKVKFGQKTGSRCYVAHVHAIVRFTLLFSLVCIFLTHKLMVGYLLKTFQKEERKVEALSAVEIFKATHNSKKVGFSADVQDAIVSHTCSLYV